MDSDTVIVHISNSQNDTVSFERKFSKSIKILELKHKLEIITGGNAASMQLELYSGNRLVTSLNNDDSTLGSFNVEDGMRIHVIDNINVFEEGVQKFELTKEQYENRQDSLKSFLMKNKLGKYNEEELKKIEEEKQQQQLITEKHIKAAVIGARCKVTSQGKPTRLGTVMYNGSLDGKKGTFIGVKLDEPLGSNDGTVEGKRYFECAPKYGCFVPPTNVEVGDFPPEEINFDDEL